MTIKAISLGYDCSSAGTIVNLKIRQASYPFDWVISDYKNIIKCLETNFIDYHQGLRLSNNKTRIIDKMGFEFPHDYLTIKALDQNIDKAITEDIIIDNWEAYISDIQEKYKRRCIRFMDALKESSKIIFFYRGDASNCIELYDSIKKINNNLQMAFVVSTITSNTNLRDYIFTCNPEQNGIWNSKEVLGPKFIEAEFFLNNLDIV